MPLTIIVWTKTIERFELISKMSYPVVFHNGQQFMHDSFKVDPCLFCCCLCCCGLTAISRCLIQESEFNPGLSKTSCSPTNLSVRESILIGFQLIVCCTYWWVDREGGKTGERVHVYDCSEEIIQTDRLKIVQNRIMDEGRVDPKGKRARCLDWLTDLVSGLILLIKSI